MEENALSSKSKIIIKYQTLDEMISPNFVNCSNEIKEYLEMEKYDCSFQVEDMEFDIKEKFILDRNGNIDEYWTYKSEGPLTYTKAELRSDPRFLNNIGGLELKIKVLENQMQILANRDTLTIEKIFHREKLILMKKDGDTNKRILFEFE